MKSRPRSPGRVASALDPSWAPEIALEIAREAGMGTLGDHQWKVITCCREEVARTGRIPSVRAIEILTGYESSELHRLFPGEFETLFTRIAGLRGHIAPS